MSFFESIKENFIGEGFLECISFRAVVMGDNGMFVENVSHIKSYSTTEIVLQLKKGIIVIGGSNLYIKKYCCGDIVICGKIETFKRA